jgi:3',5'-cyclic AMP phosphodiesterase CpdA
MRIIHISDLHFPVSLNPIALRKKSLIGYVNYAFRRRKKHQLHHAMVESIQSIDYDCLVISGDITNISDEKEFREARKILDPLLDERTFIIPGNHDRYTQEAFDKELFEKYFSEFTGESHKIHQGAKKYLKTKKVKNLVLYGLDSSLPLPPLQAQGEADLSVVQATVSDMEQSKDQEYIVVCHHPIWNPPLRQESDWHKMINRDEVLKILKQRPPIAFLHGHLHTNWVKLIDEKIPFFVINSASSTRDSDPRHESGYHILTKEDEQSDWVIHRMVYDFQQNQFLEKELIKYKE